MPLGIARENAMPVREAPPQPPPPPRKPRLNKMRPVDGPPAYPGEKARGGEIILHTPTRRIIFIAALAGIVVLVLLLRMLA
jgi:hypothetical protein